MCGQACVTEPECKGVLYRCLDTLWGVDSKQASIAMQQQPVSPLLVVMVFLLLQVH
jgi:hypothetical protein